MNKKGFTLIELLAVIVILAVIALIVTPIVTGIIKEAKDSANARSVEGHIKNIEYQLIQKGFKDGNGNLPSGTYESFSDFGFTNFPTNDNIRCTNYVISNGTVVSADDCSDASWTKEYPYIQGENVKVPSNVVSYNVYNAGDEILYNVTDGSKCTDTSEEGCMRFYVITTDDDNTKENIEVILDRNTTALTDYATALTQVGTDTADWTVAAQYDELNGRLITADEVATIVGHNNNWNSTTATTSDYFYFDGNDTDGWQTKVANASNPSSYAWLYNNTGGCINFGCAVVDSSTLGYWTSTLVSNASTRAWYVTRDGRLHNDGVGFTDRYGVRPVITISKSNIS